VRALALPLAALPLAALPLAALPLAALPLAVLCLPRVASAADAAFAVAPSSPAAEAIVADVDTAPEREPEPRATEQTEARDLSVQRPINKDWQLLGELQYRTLAVRDEDPANDQRMFYRLQGAYDPLPNLTVFARLGLEQRFVSVEDESGVRMEDTAFGAMYQHSVSVAGPGWQRPVNLLHRLRLFLPTSFQSQQDDLYLAAEWTTRARVRLVDQLFAGVRGLLHYRVNEYAEQAGPGGEALPRFVADALLFAEYSPLVSAEHGTLTVGADIHADATIDYPSRDPASLDPDDLPPGTLGGRTDTILGAGTSDSFYNPHFGYDLYVLYQPPIEHVLFMASLEQVGNAVRYGESRLFFFHRDETELVLRVVGTY
jgi:hypothetical protein